MKQLLPIIIVIFFIVLNSCNTELSNNQSTSDKIYLNYTKTGLDSAYSQSHWAPNRKLVFSRIDALKALAAASIDPPLRIQYGNSDFEQLDLYKSTSENVPVHIFIHGGAWRSGNGDSNSVFNARMFVESGVLYVAPDYQLVQDANGSLYPMVEQLRKAVVWTYNNASKYGGNPDRIFLSGHSAGGHLGGVLITTDWVKYNIPGDVIKGAFLSSGMYDLNPVSISSRNEYVNFTKEMITDLSPIKHIEHVNMPVILAYGTEESPEFKRQSQEFARVLEQNSRQVDLHILEGYNHFEIMIALGNPYALPGQLMLSQMGL